MEPVFLRIEEVLAIHEDQIEAHGGTHGLRDLGLLESALAQPAAAVGDRYLHEVFKKALAEFFRRNTAAA